MRSAEPGIRIETFTSLESLPDDAETLFAASRTFFSSKPWWQAVQDHAIPPGAQLRLVLVRRDGDPAALFPMLHDPRGGGFRALTTPYTCLYEPLISSEPEVAFTALARFCRAAPSTRLDALDPTNQHSVGLAARRAGLAVARFDHFGNWYEDISGLDWTAWLARRDGALRETIRRRTRQAERVAGSEFRLSEGGCDLAACIDAFGSVYARSWKEPEPYPAFNPAQIRAAASLNLARLGIWRIDGVPVAAQFWIVEQGRATVLKLAHDEAFRAHSPGTVLTGWMIRHLIARENIRELDFGRGDDAYKKDWVSDRRQRIGLMLINPRRPAGMIALARHGLGRIRARLHPT